MLKFNSTNARPKKTKINKHKVLWLETKTRFYKLLKIFRNIFTDFLDYRPKILKKKFKETLEIHREEAYAAVGYMKNNKNLGKDEIKYEKKVCKKYTSFVK